MGVLHMRSSEEESVRETRQQCEHGAGGTGQGGADTGLGGGLNWRVMGGMEVVIFTSLIDAECFNFAN